MADAISTGAIEKVLEIAPAKVLEVGGYEYFDKGSMTPRLITPPIHEPLAVSTLSGFAALIDHNVEKFEAAGVRVVVHVSAFDEVRLVATASDKWGRRPLFATAKALPPERTFKFNTFQAQEDFNIALRSMFVQDSELDGLVALAGNLAAKSETRQEDDGFTQNVTMKGGVYLVETMTVKPRVTLRPFRTFTEVEQPAGDFIFRVKSQEPQGNLCALFEADAGAWKNKAMDTIADWLRNRLKGSAVAGVGDIPVIS